MSEPDTNGIVLEHYPWDGRCLDFDPTEDGDAVELLRSENAYLRGKIEVYEKFLKDKGYIKEEE